MKKSILVIIAMTLSSFKMSISDDFPLIGHRGSIGFVTENINIYGLLTK